MTPGPARQRGGCTTEDFFHGRRASLVDRRWPYSSTPLPIVLVAAVFCAGTAWAVPPAATPEEAVLELPDDCFAAGRLAPAPAAAGPRSTFLWKSPRFPAPLEFSMEGFRRIRFAAAGDDAAAGGGDGPKAAAATLWRAETTGGDIAVGELVTIDGKGVGIRVPGVAGGPLVIPRDRLERLARVAAAARAIVPGRLADWKLTGTGFEERAGRIEVPAGGRGYRGIAVESRAVFDLGLSWDERPDFEISFTATEAGKPAEDWRIEAADGEVVAIREGRTARLGAVGTLPAGQGGARIRGFVDRGTGRMVVVLPGWGGGIDDARPAFDETVAPASQAAGGVAIKVSRGTLRIDSLRVDAWGDGLRMATGQGPADGGAAVESFAAATGEIVFRTATGPKRIPVAGITEIPFTSANIAPPPPPAAVRLALRDGTWLTGRLLEVTDRTIRIDAIATAAPVECDLSVLEAIEPAAPPHPAGLPARPGLLEGTGVRLLGCLVPAPGGAGIAWLSRGAVAAAPLDAAAVAESAAGLGVSYRGLGLLGGAGIVPVKRGGEWLIETLVPGGPAARDGRLAAGGRILRIRPAAGPAGVDVADLDLEDMLSLLRGVIGGTVRLDVTGPEGPAEIDLVLDATGRGDLGRAGAAEAVARALDLQAARLDEAGDAAADPAGPAIAYLKTGDSIRCAAVSLEDGGLRIRTDRGEVVVPAVALRAVEFTASPSLAIPRDKLGRLLTLPRMQVANPPPHMLRLETGDYLRGRAVALDEQGLRFEVLGTVKTFPRSDVARLIWLSVEGDGAEARAAAAVVDGGDTIGLPARARMTDGRWLSFSATGVAADRLLGTSAIFGPTGVALGRCTRLDLGLARPAADEPLPYSQWRLKPAPPPKALRK